MNVLFAAALLLAALAPAKTQTVIVNPAALTATSSVSGSCWVSSIASRRPDAYRCMVGNTIHDPCFEVDPKTVACPTDLAAGTGIRIALNKPLPQPNAGNFRNAWMMRLAGGATCNVGTGTVNPDYPYYCTQNLVCAAPVPAPGQTPVFVRCAHPKAGGTVSAPGRYLVTVMYE